MILYIAIIVSYPNHEACIPSIRRFEFPLKYQHHFLFLSSFLVLHTGLELVYLISASLDSVEHGLPLF